VIDIFNIIFTYVVDIVKNEYPTIFTTSDLVPVPTSFPCLAIVEQNNYTMKSSLTQEPRENHAYLMYQIDVFSNKKTGKRSECMAIFDIVDKAMQDHGFVRLFLSPTPNLEDASIYRMTGRYEAVVSNDLIIYRR